MRWHPVSRGESDLGKRSQSKHVPQRTWAWQARKRSQRSVRIHRSDCSSLDQPRAHTTRPAMSTHHADSVPLTAWCVAYDEHARRFARIGGGYLAEAGNLEYTNARNGVYSVSLVFAFNFPEPAWRNGIRGGLKNRSPHGVVGSNPTAGTALSPEYLRRQSHRTDAASVSSCAIDANCFNQLRLRAAAIAAAACCCMSGSTWL